MGQTNPETHELRLNAFFAGLGPLIDVARATQKQLDRQVASSFSLFNFFRDHETALSRIFADLLNPNGTHGQGQCFVRIFLELLESQEDYLGLNPGSLQVFLEHATNENRRIDIVLKFPGPPERWIGIENKPGKGDLDSQVDDYLAYLTTKVSRPMLLYLSGDGTPPGGHSSDPEKNRDSCLVIPYREKNGGPSIEAWLHTCWQECEAENFRWFLKDLLTYVRQNYSTLEPDDAEYPGNESEARGHD